MSETTTRHHPGSGVRNDRRGDMLVHAFAAVAAVAVIGLLADVWQVVFLAIPAFALVMMLTGSLRQDDTWERGSTIAVIAYCAGLAVLVAWSVLTVGSDARFWGLPVSMAVIVYLIWPYTAAVSGLLYAFVFDRTLKEEVVGAGTR